MGSRGQWRVIFQLRTEGSHLDGGSPRVLPPGAGHKASRGGGGHCLKEAVESLRGRHGQVGTPTSPRIPLVLA